MPWADVVAAAERGDDGVCVEAPKITPFRSDTPRPERMRDEQDEVFARRLDAFERTFEHAYLRAGDKPYEHVTHLYQQSW